MNRLRALSVLLALLPPASAVPAWAQTSPPPAQSDRDDNPTKPDASPPRSPAAIMDRLFERLAAAQTPEDAKGIAETIQRRWARSGSDTADLLMTRAQAALREKKTELAIELLDRIISLEPDWAEAWNQRANALFISGDSIRSVLDIGEALKREPRHYGAMTGLGMILRQQGDDKQAMVAYRRALALYPQLETVKRAVESLKFEVDGREI